MSKIRILIADDHQLIRNGLRVLLGSLPEVEVVGEAGTGEQAIEQAAAVEPDVILMDIHMPGTSGIDATRRILASAPRTGIVMLTMLEDDDLIFAAIRAGAIGYILKSAEQSQIVQAVQSAANGEALFSPAIAKRLIRFFAGARAELPAQTFPELTDREREILSLIAQGLSNAEIADRLTLSVKTVHNHTSHIFNKLQVTDRAKAIVRARQAGLG